MATRTNDITLTAKGATYRWWEEWLTLPENETTTENGRTHGVVALQDGRIVVFAQAKPAVHVFDSKGKLLNAWGNYQGAHGLTLVREDGEESLWLTDQSSGAVHKATLDGKVLQSIPSPPVDGKYSPTWVAINPANGDVWVADGYGTGYVRRYDADGSFIGEINGEEGAGKFNCPHGIAFGPDGNLYITDRANMRIAVYDADGAFLRHKDGVTHSPCSFHFADDGVYIPELFGSLKHLDLSLNLVSELGANYDVRPKDGWPGQEGWGRPTLPGWPNLKGTDAVRPGALNSPHDVCVAPNGDIYVVEWIIGGRITRLERIAS